MTDEQFRELRQHMLDIKVEIAALKLKLASQEKLSDARHKAIMDLLSGYEMVVEGDEASIELMRRIFPDGQT